MGRPVQQRGPDGKKTCTWCGGALPKRRRAWCSDACSDEYAIRSDPTRARYLVERRDKGICAICGRDCLRLERSRRRFGGYSFYSHSHERTNSGRARRWRRRVERWCGIRAHMHRVTFWDLDHILPVAEGGGGCGLDNLRTLCVACHVDETAKLRKRLAHTKKRDHAKQLGFEMPDFSERNGDD